MMPTSPALCPPYLAWLLAASVLLVAPSAVRGQEPEQSESPSHVGDAPSADAASAADPSSDDGTVNDAELLPRHRLLYDNLFAARLNPLGMDERPSLSYRMRLWDKPGILFRDAYVGVGLTPSFNPSILRLGGGIEFKPLAVLLLSAHAYWIDWTGTFGNMQSYPTPNAPHSDSDLDVGEEAGLHYSTTGLEVELQVQALAKVGPAVLRNDLKLYYDDMELRAGDTVYYNSRIDAVVPNEGWSLTNDTDLVWLSGFGLVAGMRATATHAFYSDDDFLPGEDPEANENVPSFRVGPLLAWVLSNDDGRGAFSKPTVLVVVNWWVAHPYRTGEDVRQAVPYMVLGFKFGGELWSSKEARTRP